MKVFIWRNPYRVSYGSSLAIAVAETVEEAREKLKNAGRSEYGYEPESFGAVDVAREPDRILDAPCAEVYEWHE